jgi:hypothetical protein
MNTYRSFTLTFQYGVLLIKLWIPFSFSNLTLSTLFSSCSSWVLLCFVYYLFLYLLSIRKNKESNWVGRSRGLAFFEIHFEKLFWKSVCQKKKITTAKKICDSQKKVWKQPSPSIHPTLDMLNALCYSHYALLCLSAKGVAF